LNNSIDASFSYKSPSHVEAMHSRGALSLLREVFILLRDFDLRGRLGLGFPKEI